GVLHAAVPELRRADAGVAAYRPAGSAVERSSERGPADASPRRQELDRHRGGPGEAAPAARLGGEGVVVLGEPRAGEQVEARVDDPSGGVLLARAAQAVGDQVV